MTQEEPQITTISEKGQVVIPQSLRSALRLKPGTKFLVFGRGDTVVMKRLELPDVRREWEEIFKMMDKKGLKLSEKEVQEEVATIRREKGRIK
jgi:AbrB family looped-hinge helix DNA binding protein